MKKLIILLTTVLFAGLWISCAGPDSEVISELELLRGEYNIVGIAHNEALDMVFRDLAQERRQKELSYDDCIMIAERCLNSNPVPSLNSVMDSGESDAFERYIAPLLASRHVFSKAAVNEEIIDALSDSIEIIEKHKVIFDEISQILDSNADVIVKAEQLEQLYPVINADLENEAEKTALMHSLSTIIHSIAYWDEHWHEWEEVFSDGMQKATAISVIGAIGIIDGVGAVIGTIEGFLDTQPGEEGRAKTILRSAVFEGGKFSISAGLSLMLL